MPFCCSHDSKQGSLACLSWIYVAFIKSGEIVYVPPIIICRLLTSPSLAPFVFLPWIYTVLRLCDWPPGSLKSQSASLCTSSSSTSRDSVKIFSETVHLRTVSAPRIGNGKKHMLGQVGTVLILLSNILYDSDLITLIY